MSTFSGITLLGTEVTHAGASGLAFSAEGDQTGAVVVLSPSTGRLLEARNVVGITSFQPIDSALRPSFLSFAERSEGGSGGAILQWLDPPGTPSVVDHVPPGIDIGPTPKPATAVADATTKSGVTLAQFVALNTEVLHSSGVESTSSYETTTLGVYSLQVTLSGSATNLAYVEAVLRSSPISDAVQQVARRRPNAVSLAVRPNLPPNRPWPSQLRTAHSRHEST